MKKRRVHYFDGIIKIEDFDFVNFLFHEKSYENILVYEIWYKALIGAKPLSIRLDKVDGFIKVYDGTGYLLVLKKYDAIYNRTRYLINKKNGYTCFFS